MEIKDLKILLADLVIDNADLRKKVEEQTLEIERLTTEMEKQKQNAGGEAS